MPCQPPQDGVQLTRLRVGIIDVDVVLALSLVGGIGQEPKPRIRRETRGSKADQLLPRSVAGHDPARGRQARTRNERHTTILPPPAAPPPRHAGMGAGLSRTAATPGRNEMALPRA